MHSHGRALNGLSARAVDDVEDYDVREGELIPASSTAGTSATATSTTSSCSRRSRSAATSPPGTAGRHPRVPAGAHQRQHYRIYDAATGLIEEGRVDVADMIAQQPWLDERGTFPVEVAERQRRAAEPRPSRVSDAIVVGSGPERPRLRRDAGARGGRGDGHRGRARRSAAAPAAGADPPGLIHDHCSAVHPMAVGSPFLEPLGLERHGLEWRLARGRPRPPARRRQRRRDVAIGRGDRRRARRRTGARGDAAFGAPRRGFEELNEDILQPVLHLPRHPIRLARFGLRAALPATRPRPRAPEPPQARALFGGVAAHAFSPLNRPISSAVGVALITRLSPLRLAGGDGGLAGDHRRPGRGPCARRGAGSRPACAVRSLDELPAADAVVFDLAPAGVAEIAGERLPPRVARAYRRYRHGPGAFKVDLAVEGGVPWTPRRAGGPAPCTRPAPSRRSSPPSATSTAGGCRSGRSSSSASSTWPIPCRSAGDVHPIWAYAHVPNGYEGDATEAVLGQIERFAPGLARADRRQPRPLAGRLAAYNANYVGGDIITGANTPSSRWSGRASRSIPTRPGSRRLHLLGRDSAGCRRPRDERLQRRPVGTAAAQRG